MPPGDNEPLGMPNPLFLAPQIRTRILPFVVFVILTASQDLFGGKARYWVYLIKTVVGLGCFLAVKSQIFELRDRSTIRPQSKSNALPIIAGISVFAIWVGLNSYYPKFGKPGLRWNPFGGFAPSLAWFFVGVRLLGSALVVPFIEEVFYRSFLYRFIIKADFAAVPLTTFDPRALLITSFVFGFAHYEWLAGIICGLIYQGLVVRQGRLRDAIVAHGITNFLLGLWVVWKGAWEFW